MVSSHDGACLIEIGSHEIPRYTNSMIQHLACKILGKIVQSSSIHRDFGGFPAVCAVVWISCCCVYFCCILRDPVTRLEAMKMNSKQRKIEKIRQKASNCSWFFGISSFPAVFFSSASFEYLNFMWYFVFISGTFICANRYSFCTSQSADYLSFLWFLRLSQNWALFLQIKHFIWRQPHKMRDRRKEGK